MPWQKHSKGWLVLFYLFIKYSQENKSPLFPPEVFQGYKGRLGGFFIFNLWSVADL